MNAMVGNTGVVYTCPVEAGDCSPLMGTGLNNDRFLYDVLGMTAKLTACIYRL